MDDMIVDDNLTEGSPDIEYEIIKQSHTNEEYREIIDKGVEKTLEVLEKEMKKDFKEIGKVTIEVGDKIDGHKIISVSKDPFVSGTIDIFTDHSKITEFGDQELTVYRIQKEEE